MKKKIGHFWYIEGPFLENFEKNFEFFFPSGVSILTKFTMGSPNFSKFFEKNHF